MKKQTLNELANVDYFLPNGDFTFSMYLDKQARFVSLIAQLVERLEELTLSKSGC